MINNKNSIIINKSKIINVINPTTLCDVNSYNKIKLEVMLNNTADFIVNKRFLRNYTLKINNNSGLNINNRFKSINNRGIYG